ncbi:unnamed protein product [Echinostoma caproni]|uniref:ANK_REP_REGION domain-containing protein n=1 Tax=Echinostoma caproni TaxID=27848 RepID=A0A183AII9_9TREM|nr:unnamed protein product [Echinostoma caproni]
MHSPNSFGPVAFWAFHHLVSLRTTWIVALRAPVTLQDKNGSTMLHHAAILYNRLDPEDQNGHRWIRLVMLVLLNRGVHVAVRDCWGRTARDLTLSKTQEALFSELNEDTTTNAETYRNFEETSPDLYELREIIDPATQAMLKPHQLIDRRVAQLVSMNSITAIELLLVHSYDAIHEAKMGFPEPRTATQIAANKCHTELLGLLKNIDTYQADVIQLQRAVRDGDDKTFSRLVPEGMLMWSLDWRGRNLLHLAVLYRQSSMSLRLVDLCPNLAESKDSLGRTPLHYAICLPDNRSLFLKMAGQLNGVYKEQKDFNGMTITAYGEFYEAGVPEYRNLILSERRLSKPNWVLNRVSHDEVTDSNAFKVNQRSNEAAEEKPKMSAGHCSLEKTASTVNIPTEVNSLAFPAPGAFHLVQLQKHRTTLK